MEFDKIKSWIYAETWALPLDIFRAAFGIICVFYFYALFTSIPDFSSQNGLINHDYFLRHWWYLKINLIPPDPSDLYFKCIIGSGAFLSFFLIFGIYPRLAAFILFLIAATVQRWNFAVIYVDDVVTHLVLFWLVILPTGRTLNLLDYFKSGSAVYKKWMNRKIPSLGIKLLLLNICWIYFYAGMEKAFSEMWYTGFAMYPILLIPISRVSAYITTDMLPMLKLVTYVSLVVEIILPFLLLWKKGSFLKYLGLFLMICFHLGIVATLRIPFANIAMLGSAVLFFREELMDFIHARHGDGETLQTLKKLGYSSIFSLILFILVFTSTTRFIPHVKVISYIPTQALWAVGIVQNYQLFDWINRFNFKVDQEAKFIPHGTNKKLDLEVKDFLPPDVRYNLFQLRLFNVRWILVIGGEKRKELRKDIPERIANKFCRNIEGDGRVYLKTTLQRIIPENINFTKRPKVYNQSFECRNKKASNIKILIKSR